MEEMIIIAVLVGFVASLIDGAIGMAYGVTANSLLLSLGLPPAISSSTVHISEVFTTLASGLSHLRVGNVNKKLLKNLLIPGVIGGFLGAYVLSTTPGDVIRPYVSFYLLVMGFVILYKVFNFKITQAKISGNVALLGGVGGFMDAVGGGGWGPIVTSTLVATGHNPRFTIGSVNLAEFFVTLTEAVTFITLIRTIHWELITAFVIGGIAAAPLGARICKKLSARKLMILVGVTIIILSLKNLCF